MISLIKKSVAMLVVLTLLTGVIYPLLVGVVAKAFPDKTAQLIGRSYDDPKYFWGRLSATSPNPYNLQASTGSNLGPTNDALTKAAQDRIDALHAADPGNDAPIPVDLVTASASGLDPHVSPASARYQAKRVARARGLDEAKVVALVDAHTEGRTFGVLGAPRVNVVMLNAALDAISSERWAIRTETSSSPLISASPRSRRRSRRSLRRR